MINNLSAQRLPLLADQAAPAYVFQGRSMTWQQLWTQSRKAATALWQQGYRPRQRVLFQRDDDLEWPVWFHAMILIGCVPVVVQPAADAEYVKHISTIAEPQHCFRAVPYDHCREFDDFYDYLPTDAWIILTSSGTTNNPKLILHHQHGLLETFLQHNPHEFDQHDTVLCGVKLSTSFGIIIGVLGNLAVGYGVVLISVIPAARDLYSFLDSNSVTHGMMAPRMIEFVCDHLAQLPPQLREVYSSGEALSLRVADQFHERFGMRVYDTYGFGECRTWSIIQNSGAKWRRGSVGTLSPGAQCQLRTPSGQQARPGEIGELCVKHPNLALAYMGDPERTKAMFDDGWFRTGDYMSQDSDGYFFYAGRKEQLIARDSGYISCIEIENRMCQDPAVRDCVVLQVGSDLVAYVLGNQPNQNRLTKDVSSVRLVREIPYTDSNKKVRQAGYLDSYVIEP